MNRLMVTQWHPNDRDTGGNQVKTAKAAKSIHFFAFSNLFQEFQRGKDLPL